MTKWPFVVYSTWPSGVADCSIPGQAPYSKRLEARLEKNGSAERVKELRSEASERLGHSRFHLGPPAEQPGEAKSSKKNTNQQQQQQQKTRSSKKQEAFSALGQKKAVLENSVTRSPLA